MNKQPLQLVQVYIPIDLQHLQWFAPSYQLLKGLKTDIAVQTWKVEYFQRLQGVWEATQPISTSVINVILKYVKLSQVPDTKLRSQSFAFLPKQTAHPRKKMFGLNVLTKYHFQEHI